MQFRQELLKAVTELDLKARRRLSALLAGNYRSAFRGSGMHFKEFRHYEPGDDIRHMSWPITARTGRATIKVYEEERDLNALIMVDVSGSSLYGAQGRKRIDVYSELAALLGFAAVKSGDNAGYLFFDEKPSYFLPPRRTRNHILVGLTELLNQPLSGKRSDLRPALKHAEQVLKQQSLVIILSDFLVDDFSSELISLSRHHEVILLHCRNELSREIKEGGVFEAWDPESGEFLLVDGNSEKALASIDAEEKKLVSAVRGWATRARADYLGLSLQDDYLKSLVNFFRSRGPSRL